MTTHVVIVVVFAPPWSSVPLLLDLATGHCETDLFGHSSNVMASVVIPTTAGGEKESGENNPVSCQQDHIEP